MYYFKKIAMKTKILSLTAIAAVLLFTTSCNKSILNINNNPNNDTSSTPELMLPATLVAAASVPYSSSTLAGGANGATSGGTGACGMYDVGDWMGYMAGETGFAAIQQLANYQLNATMFVAVWGNYYLNIANLNQMRQYAEQSGEPFFTAVADIMMAHDFSCLVDCYNDVPYSDALMKSGSLTPKYDKASDVYDSCIALIDNAISTLQSSAVADEVSAGNFNGSVDIMYGGNTQQWIKFANSLKLRLLLNQSQVSSKAAFIQKEVAEIAGSGGLMGIGDDALVSPPFQNTAGKTNPLYGAWYAMPGVSSDLMKMHSLNTYALSVYQGNNDPRIQFFYDTLSGGQYVANGFGAATLVQGSPLGTTTASVTKILNPTAPAPVLTASEALFDEAEAVYRGWLSGDAQTLYTEAITSSFQYTAQPDGAVTAYLQQPNVAWGAMPPLQQIITQKWEALNFIDILCVYNDYRRTGYPNDIPLSAIAGGNHIPYRFVYPQFEYTTNSANVNAEGTNIDPQTDKIFWMP